MTIRTFDDLPAPATFVGYDLQSTFGQCEAELMANQIISYCADAGTWVVPVFQFERLAKLADMVDAEVCNGGINNRLNERGLCTLCISFVDAFGVTRAFVERLVERQPYWKPQHQISRRCDEAVVALATKTKTLTQEALVDGLVHDIGDRYRTFGGGRDDPDHNPISRALQNGPLQFAGGVDVRAVVEFILDRMEVVGLKTWI